MQHAVYCGISSLHTADLSQLPHRRCVTTARMAIVLYDEMHVTSERMFLLHQHAACEWWRSIAKLQRHTAANDSEVLYPKFLVRHLQHSNSLGSVTTAASRI